MARGRGGGAVCRVSVPQDELPGGLDRHAAHASPTGGSARVQTAPLGPFHELENEPLDCLFGPPDRLFDSLTRF